MKRFTSFFVLFFALFLGQALAQSTAAKVNYSFGGMLDVKKSLNKLIDDRDSINATSDSLRDYRVKLRAAADTTTRDSVNLAISGTAYCGAVRIGTNSKIIESTGGLAGGQRLISAGDTLVTFATDTNNIPRMSIGKTTPTARLHLPASDTGVTRAPLKFDVGTVMSAAEEGAVEYDGTNFFVTDSSGTRQTLIAASSGAKPAYTDTAYLYVKVPYGSDTLKLPLYK